MQFASSFRLIFGFSLFSSSSSLYFSVNRLSSYFIKNCAISIPATVLTAPITTEKISEKFPHSPTADILVSSNHPVLIWYQLKKMTGMNKTRINIFFVRTILLFFYHQNTASGLISKHFLQVFHP